MKNTKAKQAQALFLTVCFLCGAAFSLVGCESVPTLSEEPLTLSVGGGFVAKPFRLQVSKQAANHRIYYTLNSAEPTVQSTLYTGGIPVENSSSYPCTAAVRESEGYHYRNIACGRVVKLLEVDENGAEVAKKTVSYYITEDTAFTTLPAVFLSAPYFSWFGGSGLYHNLTEEVAIRAELEYYAPSGDSFALNTQVKLGGNFTKTFPQRTLNLNFKKDETGGEADARRVGVIPRTAEAGRFGGVDRFFYLPPAQRRQRFQGRVLHGRLRATLV